MSFLNKDILDLYTTDTESIPNDFYSVFLPDTVVYKRAAGFFSSSAFEILGRSLLKFYTNGGVMLLLVSPLFSKEDCEAIELGYKAQEDIAAQKIVDELSLDSLDESFGINILAWLIYEKRLEIRIVVRKDRKPKAIFHDKYSILIDEDGNRITYRGSMNESETAYNDNYETIEVDWSWDKHGLNRVIQREKQFDDIWENGGEKWSTIGFPDAIKERLISIRKPIKEFNEYEEYFGVTEEDNFEYSDELYPAIPDNLQLYDYQKEAVSAWLRNKNQGIFEMATGSGKTKTALYAITRVLNVYYSQAAKCGLLVIVPYQVLLEQWLEEMAEFGIRAIPCYISKMKWKKKLSNEIDLFNRGINRKLFVITTNTTLADLDFQTLIKSIEGDYIICADEMHHLATEKQLSALPYNAKYRIGLSATLMNRYKENELKRLRDYFGDIIFQYSMKDAINSGALTPYYYEPIFVELTQDEKNDYYEITEKISKIVSHNDIEDVDFDDTLLKALFNQRARIIASAENKLKALRKYKDVFQKNKYNIVYCGDRIEEDVKFISKVTDILKDEMEVFAWKYTSEMSKKERDKIMGLFEEGNIGTLTAIRCLDEGVDIPKLERAFIMSSGSNPKEYIQRRGRVLRRAKDKKVAYIYDFIVIPTMDKNEINHMAEETRYLERKIIKREFDRLEEFAKLAINGLEATDTFLKVWGEYYGGD